MVPKTMRPIQRLASITLRGSIATIFQMKAQTKARAPMRPDSRQGDRRRPKGGAVGLHRQVNPHPGEGGEHGDLAPNDGELPGWAHGHSSRRVAGDNAAYPYTNPCICQDQ